MILQKLSLKLKSGGELTEQVLYDEDTGTVLGVTERRPLFGGATEIVMVTLDRGRPYAGV